MTGAQIPIIHISHISLDLRGCHNDPAMVTWSQNKYLILFWLQIFALKLYSPAVIDKTHAADSAKEGLVTFSGYFPVWHFYDFSNHLLASFTDTTSSCKMDKPIHHQQVCLSHCNLDFPS